MKINVIRKGMKEISCHESIFLESQHARYINTRVAENLIFEC